MRDGLGKLSARSSTGLRKTPYIGIESMLCRDSCDSNTVLLRTYRVVPLLSRRSDPVFFEGFAILGPANSYLDLHLYTRLLSLISNSMNVIRLLLNCTCGPPPYNGTSHKSRHRNPIDSRFARHG